ncbi:alpha-amylase family glycosyl hydrolase [Ferdinandcohnia quinoae]|uniref:alpha-amylase n=1 Tax=Fredinandcohnia quinoae TaxID=2918902 RepID=A0AAW5E755_9BACI|nr:alpha-amylase family glycosyl hydrolase [Fredinandcohnia sp. SECRCQ15]MCH1625836.1 alpha-amylase family glycosyl hydrolase [Fredinandcohnia sp. SECRCQ15]
MQRKVILLLLIPLLLFSAAPIQAEEIGENGWQDEMIYSLMIDRFSNGDQTNDFDVDFSDPLAYHGGDIQGIIDRLDFITDMGFTTILLTPIFKNGPDGYDGYSVEDYFEVDEHFGTIELFKKLVSKAHDKNLKIILDLGLRNSTNSFNEAEILKAAKWWITETDVDGYKLDSIDLLPKDFLTTLSKTVKAEKKDFFLLGQPTDLDNPQDLAEITKLGIDSVLNIPVYKEVASSFSVPDRQLEQVEEILNHSHEVYENPNLLANFIDNQDTVRFTYLSAEENEHPVPRIKVALSYLYTMPGIPVVYYGTEIALNGKETPDNRGMMDFRTEKDLIEYIGLLGKVRQSIPALTKGDFELISNQDGMIVFKRDYEEQSIIVAINNTTKSQKVTLSNDIVDTSKELRGLLTEDLIRPNDGKFDVIVDRDIAEVYLVQNDTGINYWLLITVIIIPILMLTFLYINKRKHSPKV